VYCAWAEMHIRNGNVASAITIMKYAVNKPPRSFSKATKGGGSLVNNIRAWSLYVDLLENGGGSFEEVSAAYSRTLELKIATP
jgi:hypothetical protein